MRGGLSGAAAASLALIRAVAAADCFGPTHYQTTGEVDEGKPTPGEAHILPGLRFDWTPEQIRQRSIELQTAAESAFDSIAQTSERNWETVGAVLADIEHAFALRSNNLGFLMHVSPLQATRDASSAESVALEKLELRLMSRRDVYEAVRDVLRADDKLRREQRESQSGDGNVGVDVYVSVESEAAKEGVVGSLLDPLQRRFIERVMDEFVRNGVAIDDETKRERLRVLREELAQLETDFSKEVADVSDSLHFTRKELRGCEPSFLDGLAAAAQAGDENIASDASAGASASIGDGGREDEADMKFVIDTSYPHVFEVLDNCEVEETRRRVYLMFSGRAQKNSPRLDRAVEIRHECAALLGFDSHVDYRASNRMAANAQNVRTFLEDLRAKMKPGCLADIAALRALKRTHVGDAAAPFAAWDIRYYARVRKEQDYSLDMQVLKSYFPLDTVTKGLLGVYQEILRLRFVEVSNPHVWHKDVTLYAVYDDADGSAAGTSASDGAEPIGHFFLDLHPREGKYGHAAVFGLVSRHVDQSGDSKGRLTKPYCAMVCNFPKPSAATPRPTLSHNDVETFFHEFGHVMHGLLTESPLDRFSGTHVERDFVEAPSQMLENWVYEQEVLNRLAEKPLPDDLCDRLKESRLANIAYLTSRQLFFATFDYTLHTRPSGQVDGDEVRKLWASLTEEIIGLPLPEEVPNPAASFGHLMGGYDAGYYGYLWSEVYSHDMYSVFASSGSVLNPELGLRYRRHILAPGLTQDSAVGLAAFLGREPSTDAFLHHLGLVPS